LHAGDVLWQDGNAFGGAVNMASRVCACCDPDEVMVSDTVRGLARTSVDDVTFQDRGEHLLKGIAEAQRLFAVQARGRGNRAQAPVTER
jgi:adenylate cyclase